MKFKSRQIIPLALILITIFPFVTSCNDEDDINEIFVGKTWYLSNFYITDNWKDDNASNPVYKTDNADGKEALAIINGGGSQQFYISFQEGTFSGAGIGNSFSGTWKANGKDNTLTMNITTGSAPSGGSLANIISRNFFNNITKVRFYRGDAAIFLKIFPEDKKSFMQLGRTKK